MTNRHKKSFAPARGVSDRSTGKIRRRKNVSWQQRPARPNGRNRKVTAADVGGLFFPQSRSLGIDQRESSPAIVEKIVYAGTACRSFVDASQVLKKLANIEADEKQVERLTRAIGEERVAERAAEVQEFQKLPLPKKFAVPKDMQAPDLAVVMVDGGRIQIMDRAGVATAASTAAAVATEPLATPENEDWEEEPADVKGHWREDKVGLLMTMASTVAEQDPCPEIPQCFVDPTRIQRLVRELKKNVKQTEDAAGETEEPEVVEQALAEEVIYEPPELAKRQVVASRCTWPNFAPILAAAAWQLGFQGAARKAFVGDGSKNNWVLHKRFFASFVAILDFIHALTYAFAGALADRKFADGWPIYTQWITWIWQGQVTKVIAALAERQAELGKPAKDESEASPRKVVDKALTYLRNHQDKMHYDEYRKAGLPITSSHMESTVKRVNLRVKGTEKFWSEEGGEAILQLRADHLSDDQPMDEFWQRRQANANGQRPRRKAG